MTRETTLHSEYGKKGPLSTKRLREVLCYNPKIGQFYWLKKIGRRCRDKVGTLHKNKYIRIQIDKHFYLAHRLAWLWMTGSWPKLHIDHINRNSLDNRWSNLRIATRSQNLRNRKLHKNNRSGTAGVYWHKQKRRWVVLLANKFIGQFASKTQAVRLSISLRKDWHL